MDEHHVESAMAAQEARLADTLAKRVQYSGKSAAICYDCGVAIPLPRQLAVPGCRFCVECQGRREVRG